MEKNVVSETADRSKRANFSNSIPRRADDFLLDELCAYDSNVIEYGYKIIEASR